MKLCFLWFGPSAKLVSRGFSQFEFQFWWEESSFGLPYTHSGYTDQGHWHLRAFSTQKAVFLQLHLFLLSMATICPRLFTHNCWSSSFCKTENFFAWSTKTRLNKQALFPPNLANICFAFGNSIVTDGFSKPKNQSFLVSDHHYFWGFGPTL